jgi:6-pyruvoyltetrahydropterin/6-carboxytetrahydropterin synthase
VLVPTYRLCKRFTVESGHMLSKHPEKCRFPHGHTRTIELVVASDRLNEQDMVVDFKALKLAVKEEIDRFDHRMAIHRDDPLNQAIQSVYPDSVIEFDADPTTEVMAQFLFERTAAILASGYESPCGHYRVSPNQVKLERVRVWETPTSWAEYEA